MNTLSTANESARSKDQTADVFLKIMRQSAK
jgi:hypothetical protein